MAACLSDGDFLDDMEVHLFTILSDILDVRDPAEAIFDEEVHRREKQFARELLEQCCVLAGDGKGDEEAKEGAQAQRRAQGTQALPGLWQRCLLYRIVRCHGDSGSCV